MTTETNYYPIEPKLSIQEGTTLLSSPVEIEGQTWQAELAPDLQQQLVTHLSYDQFCLNLAKRLMYTFREKVRPNGIATTILEQEVPRERLIEAEQIILQHNQSAPPNSKLYPEINIGTIIIFQSIFQVIQEQLQPEEAQNIIDLASKLSASFEPRPARFNLDRLTEIIGNQIPEARLQILLDLGILQQQDKDYSIDYRTESLCQILLEDRTDIGQIAQPFIDRLTALNNQLPWTKTGPK